MVLDVVRRCLHTCTSGYFGTIPACVRRTVRLKVRSHRTWYRTVPSSNILRNFKTTRCKLLALFSNTCSRILSRWVWPVSATF